MEYYVLPADYTTLVLFWIMAGSCAGMLVLRFVELFWNIAHRAQQDVFIRRRLDENQILLEEALQAIRELKYSK